MFTSRLVWVGAIMLSLLGPTPAFSDGPWRGTQAGSGYSNPGFYRYGYGGGYQTYPSYGYAVMPNADGEYASGYYGMRPEWVVPPDAALIEMRVPANAEVWFSGEKTVSAGEVRSFVTPALEKNRKFAYEVRVRWMENGKPVERVEKLPVHPGARVNLRFN